MNAVAASANIAARLDAIAAARPEQPALIYRRGGAWRRQSFRELQADTELLAQGLERLGLRRGMRAALMVKPGPELFALTFALFKTGAVPVLIDPGIGLKNMGRCLDEAEPEAFIGIPAAHAARILLGWGKKTLKFHVSVGSRWFWGGSTLEEVRKAGRSGERAPRVVQPEDAAAILFTSGSTGSPKGAVYTHALFSAQVDYLRDVFGIAPGETDLPTFPLFALFDAALGMTAVIPEMDFTRPGSVEPENILGPLRDFKATSMFGSPALLDRVGRYAGEKGVTVPGLKRVISAGAPVSARILERFSRAAPNAEILTPYGATEALPVSRIGHREILEETRALTEAGRGVCVGRPMPGLEVSIVRVSDEAMPRWDEGAALPPGEIGEIVVRGPVVSASYYGRPEADALAKARLPGGGVAHRMGDVGYFDERGRLWFCGRKAHRVRTPEGTLYTIPCEGVFNAHPEVKRTALVGVGEPGRQRPVLCVELEPGHQGRESLTKQLLALGAAHAHTISIRDILYHPGFPVDIRHNAKIFREKLAPWAARRLQDRRGES